MNRLFVIGVLLVAVAATGCSSMTSGRVTAVDVNNWRAEEMSAYRDEAEVVYDRAAHSEGVVTSVVTEADSGNTFGDWISSLVGILPDWRVRIQILKIEWDIVPVDAVEPDDGT